MNTIPINKRDLADLRNSAYLLNAMGPELDLLESIKHDVDELKLRREHLMREIKTILDHYTLAEGS